MAFKSRGTNGRDIAERLQDLTDAHRDLPFGTTSLAAAFPAGYRYHSRRPNRATEVLKAESYRSQRIGPSLEIAT